MPQDVKGQTETMNWLMFQMGGLGPMQGQAVHFVRFASEHVEYGINRYVNETRRLFEVSHGWIGVRSRVLLDIRFTLPRWDQFPERQLVAQRSVSDWVSIGLY